MIRRFTHLGIAVHDLDAAVGDWCRRFGLVVVDRLDTVLEGFRTAMLVTPHDPAGFAVELIAAVDPADESNQIVRFLARRGEGVFHLGALVDDTAAAGGALERAGAHAVTVPPGVLGSVLDPQVDAEADRVVVAPRSTNGVLVELLQARSQP